MIFEIETWLKWVLNISVHRMLGKSNKAVGNVLRCKCTRKLMSWGTPAVEIKTGVYGKGHIIYNIQENSLDYYMLARHE